MQSRQFPPKHALYDPAHEKDSCGVGFIAHIKGQQSHDIVRDALAMLHRMDHRGACGCEPNTGDGSGILTALPHAFLRKVAARDANITLPETKAGAAGRFAAGNIFLPRDEQARSICKQEIERIIAEQGQQLLGWRALPTDAKGADVGKTALSIEPVMEQLFVGCSEASSEAAFDAEAFERQLYLIRKRREPRDSQPGRSGSGGLVLHLFAVHEGDGVQGSAHLRAGAAVLPRLAG